MTSQVKRSLSGWCHICEECVPEVYHHYLKKHPEQTKTKLYSPKYKSSCKYKNCWNLWIGDGYCLKHIPKVVIA